MLGDRLNAYILSQRDEGAVQDEHASRANVVLDDLPAVVFAAHSVSALPPVVEGQTGAPDDRHSHDVVEAVGRKTVDVRPHSVVDVVHGRYEAPKAVHLGVVLVDFGDGEDDEREDEDHGHGRDEGVCRGINVFEPLQVGDVRGDSGWEVV
jgi:hypothetical protein